MKKRIIGKRLHMGVTLTPTPTEPEPPRIASQYHM